MDRTEWMRTKIVPRGCVPNLLMAADQPFSAIRNLISKYEHVKRKNNVSRLSDEEGKSSKLLLKTRTTYDKKRT